MNSNLNARITIMITARIIKIFVIENCPVFDRYKGSIVFIAKAPIVSNTRIRVIVLTMIRQTKSKALSATIVPTSLSAGTFSYRASTVHLII